MLSPAGETQRSPRARGGANHALDDHREGNGGEVGALDLEVVSVADGDVARVRQHQEPRHRAQLVDVVKESHFLFFCTMGTSTESLLGLIFFGLSLSPLTR